MHIKHKMVRESMATVTYSDNILIRKYDSRDRKALEDICCDTAYFGEPCDFFFSDRRLLADLTIKYYLDYEPEHIWVAEYKNEAVGYVSACLDESRLSRIMPFKIIPFVFLKALIRGEIWSKRTGRLIVYNLKCFLSKEAVLQKIDRKKFPVYIHQNIKKEFRGRGIGSRLVMALLDEVEEQKLPGIRFRALRQEPRFLFFEKFGFKQIDCKRVKSWETWLKKKPLYFMEYGKEFYV
ncbi:MAG: GNAT family N-acetyltransferase [Candidatus Omnitrophica bacterium]|nr:GNAT family N-acetyltransferase [Candidatus Omnitrophota bacterium]